MIAGWRLAGPVVMALAALAANPVHAVPPTDTFMVSATITPGCLVNHGIPANGAQVGSVGSLAFGTASALSQETRSASLLASGTFTLSCTPGVPLTLRIDGGLQPSGDRHLVRDGGEEVLAYQLYRDAAFQTAIGIDQPVAVDTTTNPDDIALPVWGRLVLPGNLPAGDYRDELVITLEW